MATGTDSSFMIRNILFTKQVHFYTCKIQIKPKPYPVSRDRTYQAFYGLKHYNLLETESFLIRKLNQPTSCLMLQFKGKIRLNYDLIAVSSKKKYVLGPLISNQLVNLHCFQK